jgi:hypothetical protein
MCINWSELSQQNGKLFSLWRIARYCLKLMYSKLVTFTPTFMSQQQLCNIQLAHKFTQNHSAEYPFRPSARHSHSKDTFSKPFVSLATVYCAEGASTTAHKNIRPEEVPSEIVCKMHVTQLLLTVHLPAAEQTNPA